MLLLFVKQISAAQAFLSLFGAIIDKTSSNNNSKSTKESQVEDDVITLNFPENGFSVLLLQKEGDEAATPSTLALTVKDLKKCCDSMNNNTNYEIETKSDKYLRVKYIPDNITVIAFEEGTTAITQQYKQYLRSTVSSSSTSLKLTSGHELKLDLNSIQNINIIEHNSDQPLPRSSPPAAVAVQGEHIPTLSLGLFHEGKYKPFAANSTKAFPFCTEIFEGEALFMINTKDQPQTSLSQRRNRYSTRFDNTSYTFDIQVQGRFRQIPQGTIFVGAEITKRMDLSLLTRGMCGTILQLGRRMNAALHHSFGDKANYELPHIVSPLWGTVDRLVITPKGQTPPPMGLQFPESQEQRADRRKKNNLYDVKIDTESVYSFSVSTSNLDLVNWKLVNLPVLSALSLHTFWADSDLRLCAYCVPTDRVDLSADGLPRVHPQSINQVCFAIDIQHASNHPEWLGRDQDLSLFELDIPSSPVSAPSSIKGTPRKVALGSNPSTLRTPGKKVVRSPPSASSLTATDDDVNAVRRSMSHPFTSYMRSSGRQTAAASDSEAGQEDQGEEEELDEEEDDDAPDDPEDADSMADLDFFDALEYPAQTGADEDNTLLNSNALTLSKQSQKDPASPKSPRVSQPHFTLAKSPSAGPYFLPVKWLDRYLPTPLSY